MTKAQLYEELNYVNATRVCRKKYSDMVLNNPKLVAPLLDILFMVNDKRSIKAAWILEFVFKQKNTILLPYLDLFIRKVSTLKFDSAIRPCAKIIEILTERYCKDNGLGTKAILKVQHKEQIVELCFDWLMRDLKVAVKVYSMHVLYLLGREIDWVYPELKVIIERDYYNQSAGFKARSRYILERIS